MEKLDIIFYIKYQMKVSRVPMWIRHASKFKFRVTWNCNDILLILFFTFLGEVVNIEVDPLFSEQKRLKKRKLTDKRNTSYPCGTCDYAAIKSSHLKKHIQSKHEGVRYPCDQCEFSATNPCSLRRHTQTKHEGVRYPCDQCEYLDTRSCYLKAHQKRNH